MPKNERQRQRRDRGSDSLWPRNGMYYARWIDNGKPRSKSLGIPVGATKAEKAENLKLAEQALAKEVARSTLDYEARQAIAQARADGVELRRQAMIDAEPALRIDEIAERYPACPSVQGVLSSGTVKQYVAAITHFAGWMGEHYPDIHEMRGVTDDIAEEYAADLGRNGFAGATFNGKLSGMLGAWRAFRRDRYARLTRNPWEGITRKVEDHVSHSELTVDELRRVAATAKGEMRTLIAVGIYTGLRLSDAATLQWGDIDLARGYIVTRPKKTRKHGTVVRIPVHPALAAVLSEIGGDRTGPVMPGLCAEYMSDACNISDKVERLFENCGIQTTAKVEGRSRKSSVKTFHSLRHTFVSLCANAGVPLAVVQEIVGHKSTAMTQHDAHISDEALQGAIQSIPAVGGTEAPKRLVDKAAKKNGGDMAGARLSTFTALLDQMPDDEIEKAARILKARIMARKKAARAAETVEAVDAD